ncbi:MAG: alpha/beta-type small acid-soluble spore protein [Clostridiales bacterium]|nr:alpha/beta-type small acid-soluble spore protein [Clostridiales bacterium]
MPNTNEKLIPQARQAMENMKYEIANELGVNLKQGYNGDLTSREAGHVGGEMVKRMIAQAQRQMSGQ